MTMDRELHPQSDLDRLYVKRKEGGRCLISEVQCIRKEENSLGFYVTNLEESLIRVVSAANKNNTRETITSVEFKNGKQKKKKKSGVKKECPDNHQVNDGEG